MEDQIAHELSQQTGIFAVAFKDLTTNEQVLIREHEIFHAASTMKTPVMIEVFKQAAAGKFALSDSILIKNDFRSIVDGSPYSLNARDDSDRTLYEQVGTKRLLSELVYDMIIVSSNLATNIIIELVDANEVTQTMRDLGAKDIMVLRGVEDLRAFEKGLANTTTAYDLMLMFEKMAKGEVVGTEACQAMIGILLDQRFNTILPARLPGDVKVAHKTGSIVGVHHDSGIVFLPDGRKYVLVILSKNLEDEVAATNAMANVSELIYKYVISDKP
ncbi:MAG: class A beta-lactamase-related serine hydrolase [Cyclobacteriaceae bacterium]|nr:class A beta-lactamase-related serine hydrolase [Cyclobacteriaceae bacterium]MDH4295967.1 class A beta-lactamase-related serine hydrolase [Cyclobacteriaceae bacterium]MDH5250126.1 class A beta-lactamase-related serine hydrolase [Cyclobacteriaceae bacterium]